MLVKICGIKTIEAGIIATEAGADYIGFVFAPSKREVTPSEAAVIAKAIPPSVQKVGVFVNESVENIIKIAKQVGLDVIQLHGNEPNTIVDQLPYKVIKAYSIDQISPEKIINFPSDYYIIDSPAGEHQGGSGKVFDWNLAIDLGLDPKKVILAGGLTPENIQRAINHVQPIGVDVSSGVETNGYKDHTKIKQFIANAKG